MSLQNGNYALGSTWALIGLSGPTVVESPAYAQGGYIQQQSAGTLWLGGISKIPGVSGMFWINTATERFEWEGPARFYLYATGATVTAGICFKFSSGISSPIAG